MQNTQSEPQRHRPNSPASPSSPSKQIAALTAENVRLKTELEQLQRATAHLTTYAPEIEARRADYQRLGECLHFFTELESDRESSLLEVDTPFVESKGVLLRAFWKHVHALTCESLNWFDLRTFRKFYTEMRLWVDQVEYERQQQYPEK